MDEVVATVVSDEMQANIVCGMLQAEGIPSYMRPATELGFLGTVGSGAAGAWRPQEIVVAAAHAKRAKELLEEHGD